MGAEVVVTPAAPAPSAPPPVAKPSGDALPSRAERKAAIIETMKKASAAEGGEAPAAVTGKTPTETLAAPAPVERKAEPFAEVAKQHKKVLELQEQVKKERVELEQVRKDAEIAKAIREGDFGKLADLQGADWYDKATMHTIGEKKPKAPEVIEQKLMEKIAGLEKEIGDLKNPKPAEVPPEKVQEHVGAFKAGIVDAVKGDERFQLLQAEAATSEADVAEEVWNYLDRKYRVDGKFPTRDDVLDACVKLEAVLRVQNELTGKASSGTNASADTPQRGNQAKQARSESERGGTKTTLTASLHQSVPVKGAPRTKEERREAAKQMLRAAREADE